MSANEDQRKHIVAWVDHEAPKVETIINKIGGMKRMRSTNQYLHECYEFASVIVRPLAPGEKMEKLVERAATKIGKAHKLAPDIILVDLNFGEHDSPSIDKGRDLALGLREKFSPTPVGVYTAHQILNLDRTMISSDKFAVQLEGIHHLYEGTSRLMGDDWYNLFERIIGEARKTADATPTVIAESDEGIAHWAPGQPLHRSPSFMRIAPRLVARTLAWIDPPPSEIILTQLAGGFSGAFVVKAEIPGRRQAYVIKMDESPQKLVQELAGHQRVKSLVGYNYYLPLVSPNTTRPEMLTPDWWGAFAMVYEGQAKPLLDHSELDGDSLAAIYSRVWSECLFDLYESSLQTEEVAIADVLTQELKEVAISGWGAMSRYHVNLQSLDDTHKLQVEHALAFATSVPQPSSKDTLSAPWIERAHGDLNCRNILYNGEDGSFRLIDFPHVGPKSCLATDFVKAETELVLIVMDWATGRDCDFSRLNSWAELTRALSEDFVTPLADSTDQEVMRVLMAIKAVRSAYTTRAIGIADAEMVYRVYLLARILKYVGYSDLTPAKRFLALLWAGQLLSWSTSHASTNTPS